MAEKSLTAEILGDAAALRLRVVNGQLRTSGVTDASVLAAFLAVPRERFSAPTSLPLAYLDRDVPAAGALQRKLLAPRTLARLLAAAAPKPGERALDVGGGSGYSAALLAELGCDVVMLESDAAAAAAARAALAGAPAIAVVEGDLATGGPAGPFDVILINGAYQARPKNLIARLADGGRLVALDAGSGAQCGVLIERSGSNISERALFDATADVLPGFAAAPSFVF